MDATDGDALLAPLRPWLRVLMCRAASCKLKNPARTEHGVVFTFDSVLHPTEDAGEASGNDAVVKLREAIDLAYRALALRTSLALHFREDTHDNMGPYMEGTSDASILRQLVRDAPFEMKISLGVHGLTDAAVLKDTIANKLVVALSQTTSLDAAFLAARARLDALLQVKNPHWFQTLALHPIQVQCFFDTPRRFEMEAPKAEHFFQQLAAFVDVLDKHETSPRGPHSHLPVQVSIASFELSPMPITPATAKTVSALRTMQHAKIDETFLTIDPRLVTCSREDLGVFLRAIRATMVDLRPVNLGLGGIVPMDNEVNVARFIRDLVVPISMCETVECLRIGGLLTLFSTPRSRCEIFQVLIDTVLVRATPLKLEFGCGEAGLLDARAFAALVRLWKSQNPRTKLRLKGLALEFYDRNGVFTSVFLDALDEVEELSISNHDDDAPRISTHQVGNILDKFQMLRKLSLGDVDLDSMHVFSEKAPPALESLSLCSLRVDDRQSFLEFTDELSCLERPLSQQLRHLSITEFSLMQAPVTFRLDELEVNYLAYALRVNQVLESVRVILATDDIVEHLTQSQMLSWAAGSVIPAPANVRRSSEEKVRRIAFLSILRAVCGSQPPVLDTFLVRQIFAFSDPWVPRSVHTR